MKLCAKSFAQTELSQSSGYEFYFAEPFVEVGSERKGNHSFDLLFYNERENRALFLECKGSFNEGKRVLQEMQKARQMVLERIDDLSEVVGSDLDPGRIEWVLCIYDRDSSKIFDSLRGQAQKKTPKYDVDLVKVWIYHPKSEVVQLYYGHRHENQALTDLLLKGFGKDQVKKQFELPYCITTHPFRIFLRAVVTKCYVMNLYNPLVKDPKVIAICDIFEAMLRDVSLGVSDEKKRQMICEKLEAVIEYGIHYHLLERVGEGRVRLICRGTRISAVVENVQNKFIEAWVEEKTEIDAEKLALEHFLKNGLVDQRRLSEF